MAVIRNINEATIAAIDTLIENGFKLVYLNKPTPFDDYPQFVFEKVISDDESEWRYSDDLGNRLDIYYSDSWVVNAGCGVCLDYKLLKSIMVLIELLLELLNKNADQIPWEFLREVYGFKEDDND